MLLSDFGGHISSIRTCIYNIVFDWDSFFTYIIHAYAHSAQSNATNVHGDSEQTVSLVFRHIISTVREWRYLAGFNLPYNTAGRKHRTDTDRRPTAVESDFNTARQTDRQTDDDTLFFVCPQNK